MNNFHICGVCKEAYRTEPLARACEQTPIDDILDIRPGTVFKCTDGLLAVMYDSEIEGKTHRREYTLLRAGYQIPNTDILMVVPETHVDSNYLSNVTAASEEEFSSVRKSLEFYIDQPQATSNTPLHLAKLSEITLCPLENSTR